MWGYDVMREKACWKRVIDRGKKGEGLREKRGGNNYVFVA